MHVQGRAPSRIKTQLPPRTFKSPARIPAALRPRRPSVAVGPAGRLHCAARRALHGPVRAQGSRDSWRAPCGSLTRGRNALLRRWAPLIGRLVRPGVICPVEVLAARCRHPRTPPGTAKNKKNGSPFGLPRLITAPCAADLNPSRRCRRPCRWRCRRRRCPSCRRLRGPSCPPRPRGSRRRSSRSKPHGRDRGCR